jgi:glycine/D-amino acid oxidase-like deaminating enzyme
MVEQDRIAVIGAGVIGCAIAWALARAGQSVLLADPEEPGVGGASFGNVGHIAAELVEPLPSPQLLFGFWRELFAFDGPLDIPWRRLPGVALWARGFAVAAFRRRANTRHLAPLVRPASAAWERLLQEVGETRLLRRHGHYQVWLGAAAGRRARAEQQHMATLEIATRPAAPALLRAVAAAAGQAASAGLEFPESAHVLDPRAVCDVLARAALGRGARLLRARVRTLSPRGEQIELVTERESFSVSSAIVCAGVWSAPLLARFGLRAPLQAVRGYHLELPGLAPLVDAPLIYVNESLLVTPMTGRLRASGYMEFTSPEAAPDPRKPARLRAQLRRLGYRCEEHDRGWVGPRPVLPDYLPGIGRAPGAARLFYAVGHQHLGLTLAPVTAELIAALVAGREPAHDLTAFDLRRFG